MAIKESVSDSAHATVRRERGDLVRPIAFAIALAMLVTATLWMHFQPGVPDPLQPVDRFSRQWWLYPIEQNAFMRLPLVSNEPQKLFVLPNSTHAWVGGGAHAGSWDFFMSGQLLHTSDRGETWEAITVAAKPVGGSRAKALGDALNALGAKALSASLSPVKIIDFLFADPSHGWVLDFKGKILETRDGGKSWTVQWLPYPSNQTYQALAASGQMLVAAGSRGLSSSSNGGKEWRFSPVNWDTTALAIALDGRVWAGTADGAVWSSADLSHWVEAIKGAPSLHGEIVSIFFENALHGFVHNEIATRETLDGGRSWRSVVNSNQSGIPAFPRGEHFSYSWERTSDVISLRKNNGLNDYSFLNSTILQDFEWFGDHRHAIALGTHGQIFVTDNGESFRRSTAPYGFVSALHADADGKRMWAAGASGTVVASRDGGATWTPFEAGTARDLMAVTFVSDGAIAWVVGDGATVMRTEDGGRNWKNTNPRTADKAFDFILASADGRHLVAGESSGHEYDESVDGANSWNTKSFRDVTSPGHEDLAGEGRGFFTADNDLWAVRDVFPNAIVIRRSPYTFITSPNIPYAASPVFAIGENGWLSVSSSSFPYCRSIDGGRTWLLTGAPDSSDIRDVHFLDAHHGFAEAMDARKFETHDGGTSWQPILNDASSWRVQPLIVNKDGKRMWTASVDGVPLRSFDGGRTWLSPQYRRFPAPWYYVTLAPLALLLFMSLRKPAPVIRSERSIEDVPWNDRPLTDPAGDRLDFTPLAAGIARFFGNPGTEPPLTIAITGSWGSGKSSLMNLVAAAVKRYDYRPVWFNAWHYQSEEFLLPAVLESMRTEAVPRFWTWHGLQFRMRLLVLRGMKNWLPALVILAVLVTTAAYFMRDHDAFRQLVQNLRNLGTEKSDKFFQSAGLVISSLLSIVVVLRSLNAFGVSGTKVAALLLGSVRLADAGGQTGFRHRFARAFGEVTRALGRNRLVLFIDDLDRCRPDHVLSVLECINFLVTSGDCFIVAGMDRPRVEQFVAIRFQDESKAIGAAETADGENAPRYLEKLINIEVPVPLASSFRSSELFAGDRKEVVEERVRATVFGERLVAFGQAAIPWIVGLAVLAGAAYLGYIVLPDRYPQQRPAQTTVITTPAAAPKSPVASAPAGMPAQPSPEGQQNLDAPARFVRPIMANRPEVLPIIGIVLIVIGGFVRLSIERAKLEQDSKDFRTALRQWHPLLYENKETPRSMKRCVNRVRYYAMRQRTNPLPPTLPERLVRLAHRLRRIGPLQDDAPLAIPENILVPVSVVQHVSPDWLQDDAFWRDPAAYVEAHNPPDELAHGIASLRACGSIAAYRSAFEHISAGIHVAGTTDGHA